jgi:hypothetical protein
MNTGSHERRGVLVSHLPGQAEQEVYLEVSNKGCGIIEKNPKIFDPFSPPRAGKGTGLGLSTSLGIIRKAEAHFGQKRAPGHIACRFASFRSEEDPKTPWRRMVLNTERTRMKEDTKSQTAIAPGFWLWTTKTDRDGCRSILTLGVSGRPLKRLRRTEKD